MARITEFLLGAVFLVSGALKAWAPAHFYQSIEGFQILPAFIALGLAYYLPYLEILVGLGLVAAIKPQECACVVAVLLGGFMVALVSAWARGLNVECGCFGISSPSAALWEPLLRDAVLGVAALHVVWKRLREERK
jgi:hypothetical protein